MKSKEALKRAANNLRKGAATARKEAQKKRDSKAERMKKMNAVHQPPVKRKVASASVNIAVINHIHSCLNLQQLACSGHVGEQGYLEAAWGSLGKRLCLWTRRHLMVTRMGCVGHEMAVNVRVHSSIPAHRNSMGLGYVMVYDPQT
eukprot:3844755-Prymnesium_polylepis.1